MPITAPGALPRIAPVMRAMMPARAASELAPGLWLVTADRNWLSR